MPQAYFDPTNVPGTTVKEFDQDYNDYKLGINTYVANDALAEKVWRLAQDARMNNLGEYETRKAIDFYSAAAGETQDQAQTSTTGEADESFATATRLAQKFTPSTTAPLTKVDVRLKNDTSGTGVVVVAIYSDDGGTPDEELAKSSVVSGDITETYDYHTARFINAPNLTSGSDYWIVVYVQYNGTNTFSWSSTTSGTDALSSTDSGTTWSSESFDLNFKEYYCTTGAPKGLYRAYKSDGTAVTLFAHGTTLYSVDNDDGSLTAIKTGLDTNATVYRFATFNDVVYYVNGYDGYRKWDFSTESQVSSADYSNIIQHKGLIFLVDKNDPAKLIFSNFAEPDTFTSTDFIYVPAPKTGDPITALASLNGLLMIWTRYKKYVLTGDDNATFRLDAAIGLKGTYSQETMDIEGNFAYFLSDDGVYTTNGSSDQLISQSVYRDIADLPNKETSRLAVNKGRVYLWYKPSGQAENNKCYVFNSHYKSDSGVMLESIDTGAYVSFAVTAFQDNNKFIVASSRIGQVYWQELSTNDYNNLGGDVNFELRTHYMHFGTPSREKEVRFWKPRFATQNGDYTVTCEYGYDLRDNYTTQNSPNLQGVGTLWGSGAEWGSFTWGTTKEKQPDLQIPGQYRRVAVRYYHSAPRQPHKFYGHSFMGEIRDFR